MRRFPSLNFTLRVKIDDEGNYSRSDVQFMRKDPNVDGSLLGGGESVSPIDFIAFQ